MTFHRSYLNEKISVKTNIEINKFSYSNGGWEGMSYWAMDVIKLVIHIFNNGIKTTSTCCDTELWLWFILRRSTKLLPKPMLTDYQKSPVTWIWWAILQDTPLPSITNVCFKINYMKCHSSLPGPVYFLHSASNSCRVEIIIITWNKFTFSIN